MPKNIRLSLEEARQLVITSQLQFNTNGVKPVAALQKIIERLGYVQIDTISIIERAHKHILWTRLPEFKNEMLDVLIDKKHRVFEFWDHAAAYLPMKYYRFTLPRKQMYAAKHRHWGEKNKKILNYILDRIKNEGPLQSRDFEDPKKRGLWWDWKPAKEGLEFLFHTGVLSAKARKSFQKVYDLTERTLPPDADTSHPTELEQPEHLIMKTIAANGFASQKEMFYLRYHNRPAAKQALIQLEEEKKIIPLTIEGIENETYYTTGKHLRLAGNCNNDGMYILSPFDNLVIQRKRLNAVFNFDYTIECYVPAAKRKFGYFCLPVLYRGEFIGRIDAKADRAAKTLRVINIFWEDSHGNVNKTDVRDKLLQKLESLAQFAGCENIIAEQLK